jgi:hypothetical protein
MGIAKTFMPSFADYVFFSNNNCSDHRIRLDIAAAFLRQAEGADHPNLIATVHASTLQQGTTKHTNDTRRKRTGENGENGVSV